MKQTILTLLIIFILLSVSCVVDDNCRKDRYVKMGVSFYKKTYNPITNKYTISKNTIDSLTVRGLNSLNMRVDSILYDNQKAISEIDIPLNKFATVSKFEIKFNQNTDTITILHTNFDQYLSLECGCVKAFSIDTVLTSNHNDSLKITNHNVNTTNADHLQIYKTY